MLKRLFLVTAAIVAAVAVWIALSLPPRRIVLDVTGDPTIPGIFHVHTNRSDGTGTPDDIAAAAARAGLKFVVFTDHGDATRTPDQPTYRSGVLCLDGVEISTSGGHYVAFDMPASPYPLGGDARDVVEDVRRLGGFGIVAHPDSPKPQLRWTEWDAPFDGIELMNPDTSWRTVAAQPGFAAKRRLLTALFSYPFRAPEVMASLIQPTAILDRWEPLVRKRRVVTMAGADAHARLGPRNIEPIDDRFSLAFPDYESTFRVMSVRLRLDRPLSGNASADANVVSRAVRNGHLFTALDGVASPPAFAFAASNALGEVHEGDVIQASGPLTLHVQSNAPEAFTTIVHEGTRTISSVRGSRDLTVHASADPGVYWTEIVANIGSPPVTWIRSNPIYVSSLAPAQTSPAPRTPGDTVAADSLFDGSSIDGWRTEQDTNSVGAFELAPNVAGQELRWRFGLAGGAAVGQFTALVRDLASGLAGRRLALLVRAEHAMRVSLQLRDTAADRWQRSIYVDAAAQERVISLDDFRPVGAARTPVPDPKTVRSVMVVVDTLNTKPGTSGRLWLRAVAVRP